jgi:hypothetical protein
MAHATVYTPTAFRIMGVSTVTAPCTGTATLSGTTLTSSSGNCFASGMVQEGVLFNGQVCTISAFTNSTTVTVASTPTCTAATSQSYTVISSACYVTQACNGWVLEIDVPTIGNTGGTFGNFGFSQASNNKPTSPSVILTVTSTGFQGTANGGTCGSTTTYTRTLWATHTLRDPYPNASTYDAVSNGGTTTFRLALGSNGMVAIFAGETVTVQVANSFYTDGSSNTVGTVAAGTSVTNNSTLTYANARTIFNWTYPGWQLVTGSSVNVRGTGFSQLPQYSLPIACVIFSGQDAHSNVATSTQGFPTIDVTVGGQTVTTDQAPIIEYVGNVSTSTFTNHDQLTLCYRAYPWIGDETAVMDSCDQTVTGSVTSGTFVANEQVKQGTTNVVAYLDNLPLGTNAPSMIIGSIISQSSAADSSHTWTGQTSGAVFTPTAAPVLVYPQPSPLASPQYYLYDSTNAYTASAYVDSSFTMSGSHTSGTFQAGEKVTQQTSGAIAYLIDVTGANGAGPIHLGQVVSGAWSTTTGLTLTGGTSGAVFTQTTTQTFAGVDTAACAVATSSFSQSSPPPACRTLNGAAIKVEAYNAASATPTHADGCGWVYGAAGYYNFTGSTTSYSNTTGKCWLTFTPINGGAQSSVVIDQYNGSDTQGFGSRCTSGSTNCGTPFRMRNITINVATAPTSIFSSSTYLWFDNVSLSSGGTAPIFNVTDVYLTESVIPSTLAGNGLRAFSTTNMGFYLIRGNDVTTVTGAGLSNIYTTVGNTVKSNTNVAFADAFASQGNPASIMPIFAFNTLYFANQSSNNAVSVGESNSNPIGIAVVQNVFENDFTSITNPIVINSADDTDNVTPVNNVMMWDNDMVGSRMNWCYNSGQNVTNQIAFRQTHGYIGNIIDQRATKQDTYAGPTASGARVGAWACLYNSGMRSNFFVEASGGSTGWPATGTFCPEFTGVYTSDTTLTGGQPPACNVNTTINLPSYKNRKAYDGTSGNSGGGDYDLLSNSPAINMFPTGTNVLPYDIAGQLRNNSGYGSAGAFAQEKLLTPVFGW